MISSKRPEEIISQANPYYLLCNEIPLPIAIENKVPEAIEFRDAWLKNHSQDEKDFCGYEESVGNFIGGAVVNKGIRQ